MKLKLLTLMGAFLGLTLACSTATAVPFAGHEVEVYGVVYGGAVRTDSGTIEGTATDYEFEFNLIVPVFSEVGTYAVSNRYDSAGSLVIGGRGGIWFLDEWAGWGLAGDISYFKIDAGPDNTTLTLVPLSLMILYRYPLLASADFPTGRLQPHAGAGVALVPGNISTRITNYSGTPVQESQNAVGAGVSLHAGCTWKLNETVGIFFEYRYLHTKLSGTSESERDQTYVTEVDLETSTISAHQLLSGISVSF